MKDAAQGVVEDVQPDLAQDLAFGVQGGAGGARPPRHATTAAAAVFVQLALRWGCNWAAQWHLARTVGKRFRGHKSAVVFLSCAIDQTDSRRVASPLEKRNPRLGLVSVESHMVLSAFWPAEVSSS